MIFKNSGSFYGVNFCLPSDEELGGNIHVRYPNSRQTRVKIHETLGIVDAMEPDYYTGGALFHVDDLHTANMINYKLSSCVKCNGIVTTKDFMKENNMGVFGRSSDCLMLAIISQEKVWMLHISAEALNNGIMLTLPTFTIGTDLPYAILGPCISEKNYWLDESKAKERLSNYDALGYSDFLHKDDDKTYVDIKGIVIHELIKRNILIGYNDFRCTYEHNLGSHRLNNGRANPIYLWVD